MKIYSCKQSETTIGIEAILNNLNKNSRKYVLKIFMKFLK
jgi:hypothetical protein